MTLKDIDFSVEMYGTTPIIQSNYDVAYTGDESSINVKFTITDEPELTGATAIVHLKFADSSHIERSLELTESIFSYTLKGTENKHAGVVRADIIITKGGAKFTRAGHKFKIDTSLDASVPLIEYAVDTLDTLVDGAEEWLLQTQIDFGIAQSQRADEWVADNDARADEFAESQTDRTSAFNASEASRTIGFNASETGRSNTFTVNENAREAAAESGEAARGESFELSEYERATTFGESEAGRVITFNGSEADRTIAFNLAEAARSEGYTKDHDRAGTDHTRAENDHDIALTDQENYDTLLTNLQETINDANENIAEFDVALQNGIVATNIAAELQNLEETYAPNIVSITSQLADKASKAELASVASGSPKGVYATLSALQSTYPTGNTNIYVVSADGNWYYWNGSAWTSGGLYQSEKLADNSVLLKNLSDDIIKKIHNIKDYNVASDALTDFMAVGTTALSLSGNYIKALSSGEPVEFKQYKDWGLPIGDKILVTFKVRANKSGNIIIYLLTNNVGGVLASTTQSISATERTVSVVMSGPTLCNGIYFVGNDFTTSGDYVDIVDLVVSDLTPVFGSGNEPTANKVRNYMWCSDNKYTDIREFLLTDSIQGAVVYVVKGTNTYTLTHNVLLSDINLVLRTDVITIAGIVVTEVRTAFTGDVVTITTNTTTLSTEVA